MSTSVKPLTSAPAAVKRLASDLGLTDTKRLTTAVALAAAEEAEYNSVFVARLRAAYNRVPATATKPKPTAKTPPVTLVPVKQVAGFEFNPGAPLDPYLVYEAFGAHQLRTALELFAIPKLQDAARRVIARNPDTKPSNMRSKPALVDYIAQHVQS